MSNPGFPGPEGSIRFIVSVPSCASSPRKSWRSCPEGVRFEAAFRLACGDRSAFVNAEVKFPKSAEVKFPKSAEVKFPSFLAVW